MDESTQPSLRTHELLVHVNGSAIRVHCPPGGPIEVDGRQVDATMDLSAEGVGVLRMAGAVYRIGFEEGSTGGTECAVLVNGNRIAATVQDRRSLLRARVKGVEDGDQAGYTVKAPMPGLVLKILVKPGDDVTKGQGLLVLEAMKMENEVKSDRAGKVDAIYVAERGPIEKGQAIMTIHR